VSGLAPLKKLLAQRVVPWPTFTMRITWVIEILPPEAPKTPAEGGS
jgi:hypothetical protein